MKQLELSHPRRQLHGVITLPSSKSLSNRALMIRALSGKDFPLHDLSMADDTAIFLRALAADEKEVNVGPAGTAMRFLLALFAAQQREGILDGSERMRQRPVGPLVEALRTLGASIEYLGNEGFPPVQIKPAVLRGGVVAIDGTISSQFISALMMIGPLLPGGLKLQLQGKLVSRPYASMTASLMETFGVQAVVGEEEIIVPERAYIPASCTIEKDWSAAAFWYTWIALADEGSELLLKGLRKSYMQGDAIAEFYYEMLGIASRYTEEGTVLRKEFTVRPRGAEFNLADAPDLAPAFAATLAGLRAQGCLSGLQTLVNKETNRIAALKQELEKTGAIIETGAGFLKIAGYEKPQAVLTFDTYQDHRMAMALAPLVMKAGKLTINDPEVVTKSYPGYWENVKECCDLKFL